MDHQLHIANVEGLEEVEPTIFEIALTLESGDKATLRIHRPVLNWLAQLINANLAY